MNNDNDRQQMLQNDTAILPEKDGAPPQPDPAFMVPPQAIQFSTRIVYLRTTTDDRLIQIEESEETQDSAQSKSDDYGPFE